MRNEFRNVLMNHGIEAFNNVNTDNRYQELLTRILNIINNPQWEICCTNKDVYIGPIGITLTGDVIAAYAQDVASIYNANGHRYIPEPTGKEKECSLKEWHRTIESEAWVRNVKIESIWIQDGIAYSMYKQDKLKYFKKLGYKIEITPGAGLYSIEEVMSWDSIQDVYDMLNEMDEYVRT